MAFALSGAVLADGDEDYNHKPEAQDFIHGAPEVPSEAWTLAAGGRIYDNWWSALDRDEPEGTNPAYPIGVNTEQTGEGTWRCKECHGWDYRGKDGAYAKGAHATGIKGIQGAAGKDAAEVAALLRDQGIKRAAGLAAVAGDFRHALLVAVELFEHDHGQEDVVFLEAEQAHRVVQQHVGVQHEQTGRSG